jgi:signal transduction histidine kinase
VLVRPLRGDESAGCGTAIEPGGRKRFARWSAAPAASDLDGVAQVDGRTAPEVEYCALSGVSSDGVPAAIDLIRSNDRCISISTWIDGSPLSSIARLDEGELEEIARRLVSIIARAHWCGWVHGDVKPSNILVSADRSVHLVDWAGARKVGERAPPGTLGYAPHWAWNPSHEAGARDDYYSLAMTLWELRHGRPAMTGDRAAILAAQPHFTFDDGSAASPTVARVFASAQAGSALASTAETLLREIGRDVRTAVVANRLIRRSVIAPARCVDAGAGPARTSAVDLQLGVDERDLDCATDSLVEELRVAHGRNALRWRELVGRAISGRSPDTADASISRIDQLRDRNAFIETEARRILSTIDRPLLVISRGEVAATDSPAWTQVRDHLASCAADGPGPGVSVVETSVGGESHRPVDRSRDVLEEVVGGTSISDRLAAGLSGRWGGSIVACIEDLMSLAAAGRVGWTAELLDVASEHLTIAGYECPRAATSIDRTRDGVASVDRGDAPEAAIERALDLGEAAALRGDLSACLRACFRAQTFLSATSNPNESVVLRLADLWAESGRADAAEVVLRDLGTSILGVDRHLKLARLAASRADPVAVSRELREIDRRDCSPVQLAELARLDALVSILNRDFAAAYSTIRQALRISGTLSLRGRLWLLTTLGNALRLRGRDQSARRVLRIVKQQASLVGSARLQVAASSNLIIAMGGVAAPSQLASEAWTISRRCLLWGMVPEGLINAHTACKNWLSSGDIEKARHAAGSILRLDAVRRLDASTVTAALRRIELAAVDIIEDWPSIKPLVAARDGGNGHGAGSVHLDLLREELGLTETPRCPTSPVGRLAPRERRVALVVRRLLERRPLNTQRLTSMFREMDLSVDGRLPTVGHLARSVVRHSRELSAVEVVLQTARVACRERKSMHRLVLSMHAAALAWAPSIDVETATWFASNAPSDERRRPAGIRLWEWRLAMRRGAIEAGSAEPDDHDVEFVLGEIEAAVQRIWPDARAGYVRSLPLGNVARLSGCAVSDDELRVESADPAAAFERVRSVLYRRRIKEERGGKRAAGLERVLQGALRLQSAVDIDGLLGEIVAGVAAVCRAERAVVVYGGGRRQGRAKVAANGVVNSIAQSEAEVSLTAVASVRKTKRACLIDDACGDEALGDRPSVMQYRPRSLIIAPLQTLGEFLGYIYVENRSVAKSFSGSDVELVEGFAAQAAFALENAQLVDELRTSCEELDRARNDAVRAESLRVVGRMASEVAHDFNNLLTAILGETQLLLESDALRGHAESLAVIERAALDGAEVVRRMQATTRVKDVSAFVVVPLRDVVRNVLDMTRWRATSGRVDVHCDVDVKLLVRGVPTELREVLTNLVVNALDAMPDGGMLRIAGTQSGGDAVLDVEDTGHGMDARTASQAFDPFFSTKGEKGNGLGLSIAFGIMQRHGGDIQVVSRPGRGTRMRLRMPLVKEPPEEPAGSEPRSEARNALTKPARALVVDDEPAIARVLSAMLRRSGLDVEVSIGGVAGLSSVGASGASYDLVITDVNMPGVNGIEVAMAALKAERPARVVLMSGSLGGREEATAQALGVHVLRKPFTVKDIDRLVTGVS